LRSLLRLRTCGGRLRLGREGRRAQQQSSKDDQNWTLHAGEHTPARAPQQPVSINASINALIDALIDDAPEQSLKKVQNFT
jgi:hypothetical protein